MTDHIEFKGEGRGAQKLILQSAAPFSHKHTLTCHGERSRTMEINQIPYPFSFNLFFRNGMLQVSDFNF
jgi:hypothetical protein